MPTLPSLMVIYHANCLDGFAAAWACHRYATTHPNAIQYDDVTYHPMQYGADVPEPENDRTDVLVVDFSFPRDKLDTLASDKRVRSVVVLDHHETAEEQLADLAPPHPLYHHHVNVCDRMAHVTHLHAIFDMERSGAGIAWDYLMKPHQARPEVIDWVEDRDLWRFDLEDTRDFCAGVQQAPEDFGYWDNMHDDQLEWTGLINRGEAINEWRDRVMAKIGQPRLWKIGDHIVPAINAMPAFASDLGNAYAKGQPFAVIWWVDGNAVRFSLRSIKGEGENVAQVAEEYAGGGHANAAGFSMPLTQFSAFLAFQEQAV